MATTLSQVDTEILAELNLSSDETVYGETLRNRFANEVQRMIFTQEILFSFTKKKTLFDTAIKTTLNGAITTSSTTITLSSSTGWTTGAGALYIDGDIINFTSRSSNVLSGVTNIDVDHLDGGTVEPLYTIPSDFASHIKMLVDNNEYSPVSEFDADPVTGRSPAGLPSRWFTAVTDSGGTERLLIPQRTSSKTVVWHYKKFPADMTSSVDSSIPDEWALRIIPQIAAGNLLIERGDDEDNLGSRIKASGDKTLFEMRKYYSNRMGGWRKNFGIALSYRSRKNFRTGDSNRQLNVETS